jgi:lipoprotein NlpD
MWLRQFLTSLRLVFLITFAMLLVACAATTPKKAHIREGWRQPITSATDYTVKSGDTLYSIAWSCGLDYRDVAKLNNLPASYQIKVGQILHLVPPNKSKKNKNVNVSKIVAAQLDASATTDQTTAGNSASTSSDNTDVESVPSAAPVAAPKLTTKVYSVSTVTNSGITWAWPARGHVIHNYAACGFNKGIDITGKMGSPILAAASGKIVYAGNGLRGYGELVIIKHNDLFLSAYAHNQRLCVQDGQIVKIGQVIAYMGNTEARRVMMHFEIRKAGKPVDPLSYLPQQ